MALGHRAFRQITRVMVMGWVQTWRAMAQPKPTLKQYIHDQLESIKPGLADTPMDVSSRDDYPDDEVPFIQTIYDDLKSYQ